MINRMTNPRPISYQLRLQWMRLPRLFALLCLLIGPTVRGSSDTPAIDPARFEKEVLVRACEDPMQMEVLPGGRILFAQRNGMVRLFDPVRGDLRTLATLPAAQFGEVGLLGLACDHDFARTGWIYVTYCPQSKPKTMRLARLTLRQDILDPATEVTVLEYPIDPEGAIHMGGGLCMDAKGHLHLGTGDNCPPIPELPVDWRPGQSGNDAMRTSANTQDLRGKILRIRPKPDGSYDIPSGNLFTDPKAGRPEIYAMGCRNPFRVSVDDRTGCVYWGDVGPNIQTDLDLGPNGYDEFHRAPKAGFFGWPLCVGPNEAYRRFDFATRKAAEPFDPLRPRNLSPNNTGAQELPPAQPAWIWYPSQNSTIFPSLGSGGRSAMAGPVYHADRYRDSPVRLPDAYDGGIWLFDWMRNWVHIARVAENDSRPEVIPFLPGVPFRKPIDLKFGPDGTLYVIEFGDKWGQNQDSQITRIVYRRGNRAPMARIAADPPVGRHPLKVRLDASGSRDKDAGDTLSFRWEVDGKPVPQWKTDTADMEFTQPGLRQVAVTVTDAAGLSNRAVTEIRVGNAAPRVRLTSPEHGSFFDWGQTVRYTLEAEDTEDGSTRDGTIESARVLLSRRFLGRRPGKPSAADGKRSTSPDDTTDTEILDPGLERMRKTTCFSCHTTKSASAGPAYRDIARRYATDPAARERLAARVVAGGSGVWGSKPMPPHPQHTVEQTRPMVDWILSLAREESEAPLPGARGFFRITRPQGLPGSEPALMALTGEYTDNGAPGASPLRGEAEVVLHARRKRAASFDRRSGAEAVDVFEPPVGTVLRFAPGDWIAFREVRLRDIERVTWSAAAAPGSRGGFSLRIDSPSGPELARITVETSSASRLETYREQATPVRDPGGLHDLFMVALDGSGQAGPAVPPGQPTTPTTPTQSGKTLSLAWLEFQESAEARERRIAEESSRKKILLIPTKLDHPFATHMYSDVCRVLAACLNETPGVEAIISPDLDWPAEERLLDEAAAIVYYSRPAGDILLSPRHRLKTEALLKKGVGFTAIHWATGAEKEVGPRYQEILGGWFNFAFSGLKVDQRPLRQSAPEHPVSRGWSGFTLRDEFYLNLKFSAQARPLVTVEVDGKQQTVAWTLQREEGGRSFGTTLGHFHDNYAVPEFRRLLVNGILWTAGVEIPEAGAPVQVPRELLELAPPKPAQTREWKLDDLAPRLANFPGPARFARGEKLFQTASCANCHAMASQGGKLGPDLTEVRVRLAKEDHPRLALLREILEPSHRIEDKYRSQVLALKDGKVVAGIIVREHKDRLDLAANPLKPDEILQVPLDSIEERKPSAQSLMPAGLVNTLTEEEILDLLAYVESGGNPNYHLFSSGDRKPEPWADATLPVQKGLRWWLDASRMEAARKASGEPVIAPGSPLGTWPDASGHRRHARQRMAQQRPVFMNLPDGPAVQFDGVDDWMHCTDANLASQEFTALLVVRPDNNKNWPGLVSGNTRGRNDYQSGFNIDLMPEPVEKFSSLMVEGPGYPGVINLLREPFPYGRFHLVTVTSRPGPGGVTVRVNGREQKSRDRDASWMTIDELSLAARYWSNDAPIPAFNRGFLAGAYRQVLLFDRALNSSEIQALEKHLLARDRKPGQ